MGCLLSGRGKFPATNLLIDENRWYPRIIAIEALPGIDSEHQGRTPVADKGYSFQLSRQLSTLQTSA